MIDMSNVFYCDLILDIAIYLCHIELANDEPTQTRKAFMKTNNTQYQVVENGKVVATGNLRQCWLYLLNTHAADTSANALAERGVYIEPVKGGAQ